MSADFFSRKLKFTSRFFESEERIRNNGLKRVGIILFVVLLIPLLVSGCSQSETEIMAVPEGVVGNTLASLEPCEYRPKDSKVKYQAECGTLVVPENRELAGSRLIALPVVRVPATHKPAAEAVFYLQGGPGQSNLSWAPPEWLTKNHDVIFVGYRGIEGSITLACPGVSRAIKAHVGKDLFSESARYDYSTSVKACAENHQKNGVDLSGYTIPNVIEDFEVVRRALGYGQINLLSESYGTRVAQLYAFLYPENLHRLILIGVNTPGRFVWKPQAIDDLIHYSSNLCAQDIECSMRTDNLAQSMKNALNNVPDSWLFFKIDPDTVRLGANFMFLNNREMPLIFDSFLAAAEGDPSGLAMLNLFTKLAPIDQQIMGDLLSKAGTVDLDDYLAIGNLDSNNSIMGAPMTEYIWPMAVSWPIELIAGELREFQETNVEMLLVNGTLDFSTPPSALEEASRFYHNAQTVLLPDFGHIYDVMTLQPEAFATLVTSYYDTGFGDASSFVHQALSFKPSLSLTLAARILVSTIVIVAVLIVYGTVVMVRRILRRNIYPSLTPSKAVRVE